MQRIHATAVVDERAELGRDVEIGPYCLVGPRVRIHDDTRLLSHVVVCGDTTVGRGNVLHPFSVIGGAPQVRKEPREQGSPAIAPRLALEIGDGNVFREHVTVNVSSTDRLTTIGGRNLFMAGCHIAHDVVIGSNCVFANGVQIAGHVVVEDWVTFGGLSAVAQRARVGQSAFVAGGAMCERDVPPFVIVQGDRARVRALNLVGLARRGLDEASVRRLRRAFVSLFTRRRGTLEEALARLDRSDPYVDALARSFTER